MSFLHILSVIFGLSAIFGATTATDAISIATLENTYFTQNGTYYQVLPNNTIPSYEKGTVTSNLGKNLAPNFYTTVYDSPQGRGYTVAWMDTTGTHSRGFGPQASEFTFDNLTSATTTP